MPPLRCCHCCICFYCRCHHRCHRAIALPPPDAATALLPQPCCRATRHCRPTATLSAATTLPPMLPRRLHGCRLPLLPRCCHHCRTAATTAVLLPPLKLCCQHCHRRHTNDTSAAAAIPLLLRCRQAAAATTVTAAAAITFVLFVVVVSATNNATLPPRFWQRRCAATKGCGGKLMALPLSPPPPRHAM